MHNLFYGLFCMYKLFCSQLLPQFVNITCLYDPPFLHEIKFLISDLNSASVDVVSIMRMPFGDQLQASHNEEPQEVGCKQRIIMIKVKCLSTKINSIRVPGVLLLKISIDCAAVVQSLCIKPTTMENVSLTSCYLLLKAYLN